MWYIFTQYLEERIMNTALVEETKKPEEKLIFLRKIINYLEENSPGMRVIKTALAVTISLVIEFYRGSSMPDNTCIAAVVCIQPTLKSTWQTAIDRTLGTIIAGVYSYVLAILLRQIWDIQLNTIGFYLLIGLLSFPLMAIMIAIKKPGALVITAIVYLVIMINISDTDPLSYTIERVVATLIGIAVALFVNWLPPLNKIGNKMGKTSAE